MVKLWDSHESICSRWSSDDADQANSISVVEDYKRIIVACVYIELHHQCSGICRYAPKLDKLALMIQVIHIFWWSLLAIMSSPRSIILTYIKLFRVLLALLLCDPFVMGIFAITKMICSCDSMLRLLGSRGWALAFNNVIAKYRVVSSLFGTIASHR